MSGSEGAGFRQRSPATRHVLVNLRQAVERWLAGAHARLRRLPPGPGTPVDTQPGRRTRPFARTRAERAARIGRRERWIALYEEVRRRHAAGEALQAISRAMNLSIAREDVRTS